MSDVNKDRVIDVSINSLSKKGNGMGTHIRPDGSTKDVEVPFALPGELVHVRLTRKRNGISGGKIEEIVNPSPDRIPPRCAHFGVCGGCRLQNLDYANQLKFKENVVLDSFKDILNPSIQINPILGCSQPWNYRNKMEFTFSSDGTGKKYLGLIIEGSQGKVFNLKECHIANSWFADTLRVVRQWWEESNLDAFHMIRNTGSLRNLTVREGIRSGDRMVILTVSGNPEYALHKKDLESFVAYLRDAVEPTCSSSTFSVVLRIQQVGKGMTTNFYEMMLYGPDSVREVLNIEVKPHPPVSFTFAVSPSAFFQTNVIQAEKLYSLALTIAGATSESVVYDLFCGTGTLGISISKHVKQVIGVELSPEAALDARTNAEKNKCTNVLIICGAVRYVLGEIAEHQLPPPDLAIIDPPRPGIDPLAMERLLELRPPKILYISCNPVTQAVNVAELMQHGYKVKAIQPVDQFPQTYHVENIVVLERTP